MPGARRAWAADLLHFWFHRMGAADRFRADPRIDAELRRRFARWLAALGAPPVREFLTDPTTARAAVLRVDQVPRNIHRGSARAFATDPLGRTIAWAVLDRRWDRGLDRAGRQFLAMPLMHSEVLATSAKAWDSIPRSATGKSSASPSPIAG